MPSSTHLAIGQLNLILELLASDARECATSPATGRCRSATPEGCPSAVLMMRPPADRWWMRQGRPPPSLCDWRAPHGRRRGSGRPDCLERLRSGQHRESANPSRASRSDPSPGPRSTRQVGRSSDGGGPAQRRLQSCAFPGDRHPGVRRRVPRRARGHHEARERIVAPQVDDRVDGPFEPEDIGVRADARIRSPEIATASATEFRESTV